MGFGSDKTTLRGKELHVPNPLLPTRPLFRAAWNYEAPAVPVAAPPDAAAATLVERCAMVARFVPAVWTLLALTFGALPIALFGRLGELAIVAVFGLVYANVLLIVGILWFARAKFGLSGPRCAAMAVDLLVCPPFALNTIRKLSLTVPAVGLVQVVPALQTAPDWETTRAELLGRLEEEIGGEEEGSPRMAALQARRAGPGGGARAAAQSGTAP